MRIANKYANTYKIEEKFEAGIALLGSEVKALRAGHADISGAYIRINGLEAYLVNGKIFPYKFARVEGYQEDRSRKLLLHKSEILSLKSRMDQGKFTIIPLSIYYKNGNFKVEIALCLSKNKKERHKDAKNKAIERDIERELKDY